LDEDLVLVRGPAVILIELAPQPSRLDPYDRVDPGIVLVVTVEHIDPDHKLLQSIALPRERALHHVAQEPAGAVGIRKRFARQHPRQLPLDLVT
jgi:hypothetical protein